MAGKSFGTCLPDQEHTKVYSHNSSTRVGDESHIQDVQETKATKAARIAAADHLARAIFQVQKPARYLHGLYRAQKFSEKYLA